MCIISVLLFQGVRVTNLQTVETMYGSSGKRNKPQSVSNFNLTNFSLVDDKAKKVLFLVALILKNYPAHKYQKVAFLCCFSTSKGTKNEMFLILENHYSVALSMIIKYTSNLNHTYRVIYVHPNISFPQFSGNDQQQTTLTCMDYNMHRHKKLRMNFLRIAYVEAKSGTIPKAPSLSYYAFYPLHNYNNATGHWETLTESQKRVQAWLLKTGTIYIHFINILKF